MRQNLKSFLSLKELILIGNNMRRYTYEPGHIKFASVTGGKTKCFGDEWTSALAECVRDEFFAGEVDDAGILSSVPKVTVLVEKRVRTSAEVNFSSRMLQVSYRTSSIGAANSYV